MNKKCNINFQTKYAYNINNECITIDEYIYNNIKYNIKCYNGHELICAHGDIIKPYFRHKNKNDTSGYPMTEWHCEWQSNFPITEYSFPKKNDIQIKDRRADVFLQEYDIIIEFQHSKIDNNEVNERKNDYDLNNKKIIWIIDGNNDTIKITELKYCNRFFLEFISDTWKYKSFTSYDFIYIDIKSNIYKIYPNEVKSDMIDVEKPIKKEDFIKLLKENNNKIYEINKPEQCNLYIKQQGAGNGKTYGLIQMLESKEFEHYKYFIIVTKQHSAKYVIYEEFKKQIEDNSLKYINIETEIDNNKKYKILFNNKKTDKKCQIIVATIDSLMYTLGNKNNDELNKYEGLVNSIVDGYIQKENVKSYNYGGTNIKLNKEVCLICDETQDLSINYAKAIIQIMRNKYIDAYIVGDKLQSLIYKENALTYLMNNEITYITKILFESTNICRRFIHTELVDFVNSIVPFEKYSLPKIEPYKINLDMCKEEKVIEIFIGDNIFANEKDEFKLIKEVEKIMEFYDKEVINNNYKPNDFLFITPFTLKNPLVNAIETAINMYWNEKKNKNDFERFAIFHKSEDGTSIDLKESKYSTRIVSIHTSKGDGRNIVFVIGLNEESILKFSNESNNLIYNSLIHVALTRMKKKLYIRLTDSNDDIYQRITRYIYDTHDNLQKQLLLKPSLSIPKNIKYHNIIESLKTNDDFKLLQINIIEKYNDLKNNINKLSDKKIIDMGHHTIRYSSMIIYLYIKIIRNELINKDSEIKKQIMAIFYKIKNKEIYETDKWQLYNEFLKNKDISILKISNNGKDYDRYYKILFEFIKDVKNKIMKILDNNLKMICPFESIILQYMIQIVKNGIYTEISINELYNLIDIYSKSFKNDMKGHNECLCKKYFSENKLSYNIITKKCEEMQNYLIDHYEKIYNIGEIYDKFFNLNLKISWLIDHSITYNGKNNDFIMLKKYKLIGYTNEDVYIVYIKPQFNSLNYNDVLIDSIYDTFIFNNIKIPNGDKHIDDNYKRFSNKNIKTILFSLDQDDYFIFDWKNENENENLISINNKLIIDNIKNKLLNKYIIECKHIYYYYKYFNKINNDLINNPDKLIKKIINEIKKDKNYDELPHFIIKFFENIERDIKYCKDNKEKKNKLEFYNDKYNFSEELNEEIKISINEYLDIEDN